MNGPPDPAKMDSAYQALLVAFDGDAPFEQVRELERQYRWAHAAYRDEVARWHRQMSRPKSRRRIEVKCERQCGSIRCETYGCQGAAQR